MTKTLTEDAGGFALGEIARLRGSLDELCSPAYLTVMEAIASEVVRSLTAGGRILFCGNGGSAADAQHLAAELVGRQNYDRAPAAGIALTVDTSVLTGIGNDYGYEDVFARQVSALGRRGDVLFGISTSGRSANVARALGTAAAAALITVALTGREPREMSGAQHVLAVPADQTGTVQELQLLAGHIIFALVERSLFPAPG